MNTFCYVYTYIPYLFSFCSLKNMSIKKFELTSWIANYFYNITFIARVFYQKISHQYKTSDNLINMALTTRTFQCSQNELLMLFFDCCVNTVLEFLFILRNVPTNNELWRLFRVIAKWTIYNLWLCFVYLFHPRNPWWKRL